DAVMIRPSVIQARCLVIAMFTATAAATETPPSEVEALLSDLPPLPLPWLPFFDAVESPKLRWLPMRPVTPLVVESAGGVALPVGSAGAPAALAVASVDVADEL